jgi:hypothetical protein
MLTPEQMKERSLELAQQEGFTDSIFNYCDRWCEKCHFTSKCRNFAMSKDEPSSDSSEVWEYIENTFKATMLMIQEKMQELGIDPSEIDKVDLRKEYDPHDHPLYKNVHSLSLEMHKWLSGKKHGKLPDDALTVKMSKKNNQRLDESLEIIYFYNFFISAKVYRALLNHNKYQLDEIQNDSNGSAKIALIAMDRLIGAWSVLMENMADHEDEILDFLIKLAEVRKQTLIRFPNALNFVRPGFDQ